MSPFQSENEMQQWLSSKLAESDGIGDLLSPSSRELPGIVTATDGERAIINSYSRCLDSLWITEVISANRNISISDGESLKPDFLLFAPETEAIVFVELKNISGPTREAGTELGAYSGELRTALPFMPDAQIAHVVISPAWPALLRHYVFHEIFWHRRNVACFRPVANADGRVELEWVPPNELSADSIGQSISPRHLGGFQICLYDDNLQKGSTNRNRLDAHIQQMKTALQVMAATGNAHNGNGFAFLWRDHLIHSLAPFSITVLNFSPFQTVERFLHLQVPTMPFLVDRLFRVVRDHAPEGHGSAISEVANSASSMLSNFCSPMLEGYSDWAFHQQTMNDRAELLAFSSWGFFQESFATQLKAAYEAGELDVPYDCPLLGKEVVDGIVDNDYPFIEMQWVSLDDDR